MPRELQIDIDAHKARKLKLDGSKPRSLSDWITSFPIVMFHPGHLGDRYGGGRCKT